MSTALERRAAAVGEVRNVAVDMRGKLDSGELLTGTPIVAELVSADLTIANKAVSTAAQMINGQTVPIGQAVQFKVSGMLADKTYTIKITVTTTASPAQTLIEHLTLRGTDK